MSDRQNDDDIDKEEELWKILYTTIFICGVFAFIWLVVVVFNPDELEQGEQQQLGDVEIKQPARVVEPTKIKDPRPIEITKEQQAKVVDVVKQQIESKQETPVIIADEE